MGPANNGSHVTGQPQDIAGVLHPEWTGVPVFVTDVRDPLHPYTYAKPVDMKRNNNTTAYTHSRRRRPARHRLDVRLRRRPRLLHPRPATEDPTHGQSTAGRRRPTRSRTRAAASRRSRRRRSSRTGILEHNSFHMTRRDVRHVATTVTGRRPRVQQGGSPVHHPGERRPAAPRRAAAAPAAS